MAANTFRNFAIAISAALILATTSAVAADYKLGMSDRLRIKVQEWPDLGGDYTVTADGIISLPLIGNIPAAGLSLDELSREISDRLQKRAEGAERPLAAVEVAQYRPFTILGDVQRPGDYPYRPGITVLQAISIAGGYYRPELGLLRLDRDIALANGDIRTLSMKQNQLIARAARLTAALAGQEEIALPPEFNDQKDSPVITTIMDSERATLAVEYEQIRSEAAALETIKSLYQQEVGSLQGQSDALTREQATIQQQLGELRSLSARGLAAMPTMLSLERSVSQIANEKKNVEAAVVRAEENIALAEQRVRERSLERSRTNTRDLQQAKDDLAEVRARIKTAGELIVEAQIRAPAEARERLSEPSRRRSFTLLRKDGDGRKEIAADEATLVLPDDVIKIPLLGSSRDVAGGPANMSRAERSDEISR